jgi:hypothetical protein
MARKINGNTGIARTIMMIESITSKGRLRYGSLTPATVFERPRAPALVTEVSDIVAFMITSFQDPTLS